jgi:lambda repressor-like predicted transcriptional regulator
MKLTAEQRKAMGLGDEHETSSRGWTNDQIKEAMLTKGFSMAAFAREIGKQPVEVYQSLNKRSPKVDKMIAVFLEVHESVIWPNRYFVNGVSINKVYRIETRSDEELATLNAEFLKPRKITVIHDWYGTDGGPTITTHDDVKPLTVADHDDKLKNADGTVDHPFYSEPIHPDVSPMADQRPVVKLPTGMKIL